MIHAEDIYLKAKALDESGRLALAEFLDFLLTRPQLDTTEDIFAPTALEDADTPSVYAGPPLTLEQMREAIDWEAGQAR